MLPSLQLPSLSGVDSKLGLTTVRHNLQSAPEPPAVDPPPISKDDVRLLWWFLTSGDLEILTFSTKNWLHLLVSWWTFVPIFFFQLLFVLELRTSEPVRDRRTDRCARRGLMRPIWPHNKKSFKNSWTQTNYDQTPGTLDLNHDQDHDQSPTICSLGCKKISKFVRNFFE